ncbi:Bile salt-activated lipase [Dissostichus eleginoides]|uniref:Bile salt-activated lipase n=1 Tax=Dissostichus eleginoides TaxID=100907 RepID=A0AAD9EW68_DISEL|nr:Bile salt-activated lipase [Dissostichus eleginoides]
MSQGESDFKSDESDYDIEKDFCDDDKYGDAESNYRDMVCLHNNLMSFEHIYRNNARMDREAIFDEDSLPRFNFDTLRSQIAQMRVDNGRMGSEITFIRDQINRLLESFTASSSSSSEEVSPTSSSSSEEVTPISSSSSEETNAISSSNYDEINATSSSSSEEISPTSCSSSEETNAPSSSSSEEISPTSSSSSGEISPTSSSSSEEVNAPSSSSSEETNATSSSSSSSSSTVTFYLNGIHLDSYDFGAVGEQDGCQINEEVVTTSSSSSSDSDNKE